MNKVKTERIGQLLEQARLLSTKPGCYLMKNEKGQIIYIGKAKNLKLRVQSYFQQGPKGVKTEMMVSHIRSFDFVLTDSEAEALVLENTLIKKHGPKYNIRLKDDKSYPYVVIDKEEPYPRLQYLRRIKRGPQKEVFGPFVVGSRISQVIKVLTKSFGLRDCSLYEFRSRKEPCLLFQMHQCSAPCVGKIEEDDYDRDLEMALQFLRGRGDQTLKAIEQRMEKAAENLSFELAAQLRDHLELLRGFLDEEKQRHAELKNGNESIDVVAYYHGEEGLDFALCMIRHGLMLGHKNFTFSKTELGDDLEEFVQSFLMDYYSSGHDTLPEKLIISKEQLGDEGLELLQSALRSLEKIQLRRPGREYHSLYELTFSQAHENQRYRLSQEETHQLALLKLQELLALPHKPKLLECYDVALFQGSSPTAAQIVFENARPKRESYRHFALEERPEGNNDFMMMREILTRRLKHGDYPDVFVVDGGLGQVNTFIRVLQEEKIEIPVVGIAKSRSKAKGSQFQSSKIEKSEERLIIPGRANPYPLSRCRPLMLLLTQMRDESHRFSRRLHHKKESKRIIRSWLDGVKGVGKKTSEKILSRDPLTPEQVSQLSVSELKMRWEIPEGTVRKIKAHAEELGLKS